MFVMIVLPLIFRQGSVGSRWIEVEPDRRRSDSSAQGKFITLGMLVKFAAQDFGNVQMEEKSVC